MQFVHFVFMLLLPL